MNLPKFIKDDERLFRLLLGDLFPSLELPVPEYGALQVGRGIYHIVLHIKFLTFLVC